MTGKRSDKMETVSVDTTLILFIHHFPLKCYFAVFYKLWDLLFNFMSVRC